MKRLVRTIALAAVALGVSVAAGAGATQPLADVLPVHAAATCSDFKTQADAQRAANTRDADGDGIYCESLPCPCLKPGGPTPQPKPPSCTKTRREVDVTLAETKFPHIARHVDDAIAAGRPRHLNIDRERADEHRKQSLKGIPTKKGFDRDEYPPAASKQGGKGADVRYVVSSENRSAGTAFRNQIKPYCNGQSFRILTP